MTGKKKPDYLKPSDDGAFIDVTLRRNYLLAGIKTNVVRMREPTVKDQIKASEMSGSDAIREVKTFADLCQLAPDEIEQLGSPDYQRLQTGYTSFFD
jgi:hypothetical protein